MTTPDNSDDESAVSAEVKLTTEGISMSLYRGMELVDEEWATWGELCTNGPVIPPVDSETRFELPDERI